jgi:hypothetical protein
MDHAITIGDRLPAALAIGGVGLSIAGDAHFRLCRRARRNDGFS